MPTARFEKKLRKRQQEGILRKLPSTGVGIDFTSNDYLGYAQSQTLRKRVLEKIQDIPLGSTGSRLLTGNSFIAEQLEESLAHFFAAEAALLFSSGYTLNLGLLSTIAEKSDTILMDQNVHVSIKQGAKASGARCFYFRHNDTSHLEKRLEQAQGIVFVVVESVYSMDGDITPLSEIIHLTEKYHAHLIVDEAHAVGVIGEKGRGILSKPNWQKKVFAKVITFGKALGVQGAALMGSTLLKEYMINFCHPLIYTTAPSYHTLISIKEALAFLQEERNLKELRTNITFFNRKMNILHHPTAVYSFTMNKTLLRKTSDYLREQKILVNPIFSPTVRKGSERLRVCIHAFNTKDEISLLAQKLQELL